MMASKQRAMDRPKVQTADVPHTRQANSILLVDDDVALRNVYQLYLETKGFIVFSAGSVVEALRVMRQEPIDLVILDIFLDQDDGLELLNGIVAAKIALPVIVMSGLSGKHDLFRKALAQDLHRN